MIPLHADVAIGFESSSGYTSGSTIIGVDDSSVTGTKTWSNIFSTDSNSMTVSSVNPYSGSSQAFRIADNSATTAYGTAVDLSSASSIFTSAFKFTVSMAVTNTGTAGNVAQFYLGYNGVAGGSQRYWAGVTCSYDGTLTLLTDSTSGTTASFYTMGNYTTFSNWGEYVTFELTIDPSTMTYTDVAISGTKSSANKTSGLNSATYHYGEIPYLSGNAVLPALTYNLDLVAGTGSMGTVDFDNISISNVPEPGAMGLVALGMSALVARLAARRRTGRF